MELSGLNILVIDDDDSDRKLLKRLLGKIGHTDFLKEVTSIGEIIGLETEEFDVIFLDYYLPGTTGLSHLSDLRTRWPRSAILLMTGQGSETVAKSAILGGATDYVSKGSVTAESLRSVLTSSVSSAYQSWRVEQQRLDLATFSEVLVHDFKAPIRAAAYLAEQIDEDLQAGDIDEVQQGLRLLKKSASQMNAMILSLSDHIRLDRETVAALHNPKDLIEAALVSLSLIIQESDTFVDVVVEEDVPEFVCNGPQIAQLLQNLIANAIKFRGGQRPEIVVHVRKEGGTILFEVADNGIGIASEHLDQVFEPFKRAPGSQGVAGTGLGLSTCRKIVLRHEGKIWCRSTVGRGTSMFFALPIQRIPQLQFKPVQQARQAAV